MSNDNHIDQTSAEIEPQTRNHTHDEHTVNTQNTPFDSKRIQSNS